jgi:PAS domain S-box-containing protein
MKLDTTVAEAETIFKTPEFGDFLWNRLVIGIALVAPDGRWLKVNPRMQEMLGYTEGHLISGVTFQDVTEPSDAEHDLRELSRVVAGEIPYYSMDKNYITRFKEILPVKLIVYPWRNAEGEKVTLFLSQIEPRVASSPEKVIQDYDELAIVLRVLAKHKKVVFGVIIAIATAGDAVITRIADAGARAFDVGVSTLRGQETSDAEG